MHNAIGIARISMYRVAACNCLERWKLMDGGAKVMDGDAKLIKGGAPPPDLEHCPLSPSLEIKTLH